MSAHVEDKNCLSTRYDGRTEVWKFGYGSNMGPEFLRKKKRVNPIRVERGILRGLSLSFPKGKGIDFVEPSFATLKLNPEESVHGVCTLLSVEDAISLNKQEGVGSAYNLEIHKVLLYDGSIELDVEVYAPTKPIPVDFPEGECSVRYRDILVRGASEMSLDSLWVEKLKQLPVYIPSALTLSRRTQLPLLSTLPVMTVAELALHNGSSADFPHYISSCGYVFKVKDGMPFHGRDITIRNVLHSRGINIDSNDNGGVSPFPRLSQLEPTELEYALQYRDRYIAKAGQPLAILKEFWEEQDEYFDGVFTENSLSKL